MSRVADAVIAGVLLAFTLPLMILLAVAIRFDSPGPVFERELCVGRGGRFQMLQFRTSVHSPEGLRPTWARRRLTRVGAFLQYTRIDSLPQLLNVLAGDMTLIDADGRSPSFLE
ncbi:MAG: sugar transferase [Alphaproteobacteria bacterium]|nr:sugar transferase [Alphaproteobacteria bacterium]